MMIRKLVMLFIIMIFILLGCTSNNDEMANEKIEQLQEEILALRLQHDQALIEIDEKDKIIEELINDINELDEEKVLHNEPYKISEINVFDEGLYFETDLFYSSDLSVQLIEEKWGEPVKSREYIDVAHCSCKETEITYPEAMFVFRTIEGKEEIKYMIIRDSAMLTDRGIKVGSSRDQVIEAYGTDYWLNDGLSYGEKTGIRFKLDGDHVNEITIWYMYE